MATTETRGRSSVNPWWISTKLALLLLAIAAWQGWVGRPAAEPSASPREQQRMPITHPILESDRPDLLGEPGMEMGETDGPPAATSGDPQPGQARSAVGSL
jgi:hypothetical protein